MTLFRNHALLLLIAVSLSAASLSHAAEEQAAAPARQRPAQTWAARSDSGVTMGGTWTAMEDEKTGAVTGTFTVSDETGRMAARGGWSATKSVSGWMGNWRAAVAGQPAEHSGTWTASIDVKPDARLSDLFATAASSAVTGTWAAAGQSGAWTIRTSN